MPTAVGKQGVVSMIFVVPLLVLVSIILPRSFTDGRNNIVEENTKTLSPKIIEEENGKWVLDDNA